MKPDEKNYLPAICANCLGDKLFLPGSTLKCHYCQGTGTVYLPDTPITRAAFEWQLPKLKN